MGYEKRGGKNLTPEFSKTGLKVTTQKRRHAHLIFNETTFKKLKIYAAGMDISICDCVEEIVEKYLREKGKL